MDLDPRGPDPSFQGASGIVPAPAPDLTRSAGMDPPVISSESLGGSASVTRAGKGTGAGIVPDEDPVPGVPFHLGLFPYPCIVASVGV